jgi:hypothetical protein
MGATSSFLLAIENGFKKGLKNLQDLFKSSLQITPAHPPPLVITPKHPPPPNPPGTPALRLPQGT